MMVKKKGETELQELSEDKDNSIFAKKNDSIQCANH